MALTYGIEEDIRFQQGETEGSTKTLTKVILNMFELNFSIEQIMQVAEVSKELVEKIAKELKK